MTGRGCPHSARFHYPLADGHGTACTACDARNDATPHYDRMPCGCPLDSGCTGHHTDGAS